MSIKQAFGGGGGMPGYPSPFPGHPSPFNPSMPPPSSQYTCKGSQKGTCPPRQRCEIQNTVSNAITYACQPMDQTQ